MNASRPLDTEDWRRINDLFHRALEEAPERRAAFLDESCGGDEALRQEVASLLEAHARAADFIEAPAQTLTDLDADPTGAGAALVGSQIGQYRIERVLGEGGMGVVYLAEDVRLGRTVALKALAPRYTGDAARRERLRREARAAASLTHPGIATVYALEEFDGQIFIAGEYVPGETLREELARGPLSAMRSLETALGVARALAAAHDRGIVHRDLKPENIVRTGSGDVKILDFGLARFRDPPPSLAHLTDDGMILGTPAYMSPEQIRGTAVDGRSDLFSLGIVLYELVAGQHPFAGSDPASTIARILEAEPARLGDLPPAARWNPAVLGALEDVVTTCLRKVPDQRFRSAHDLIEALEHARLRERRARGTETSRRCASRRALVVAVSPGRGRGRVCRASGAALAGPIRARRPPGPLAVRRRADRRDRRRHPASPRLVSRPAGRDRRGPPARSYPRLDPAGRRHLRGRVASRRHRAPHAHDGHRARARPDRVGGGDRSCLCDHRTGDGAGGVWRGREVGSGRRPKAEVNPTIRGVSELSTTGHSLQRYERSLHRLARGAANQRPGDVRQD